MRNSAARQGIVNGRVPRTPQAFTILSRAASLLPNGFSANSAAVLLGSKLFLNSQDGKYYIPYGDGQHFGLAQASSQDGPWTDLGYPAGLPGAATIQQHRVLLTPDNKWSWYTIQSSVPVLYQTAASAAINSTYTQTGGNLIALGTAGAWDAGRISEPYVFQLATTVVAIGTAGTWCMLYMGEDSPATGEQGGLAISSGDHTGPYTKYSGNPIIAKGGAATFDGSISGADPILLFYNGVYYIFCAYGRPNQFTTGSVTGAAICGTELVTTTDWVTFTKRGDVLPTGQVTAADCAHSLNGDFYWPGRTAGTAADLTCALPTSASILYRPYFARNQTSGNAAGVIENVQLMKLDPQSIFGGSTVAGTPWTWVAANSGSGLITNSGTWTSDSSSTTFKRGTRASALLWSNTAGNFGKLTWTGRRARVWLVEGQAFGIANILLDGVQVATYDGNWRLNTLGVADTLAGVMPAYDTGDLMPGAHTLQVTVTGTKDASGTGVFVYQDGWEFI
jgi:hypothetical protein